MNTQAEIFKAFSDYHEGYELHLDSRYLKLGISVFIHRFNEDWNFPARCSRNGFEKAIGWRSENGRAMIARRGNADDEEAEDEEVEEYDEDEVYEPPVNE